MSSPLMTSKYKTFAKHMSKTFMQNFEKYAIDPILTLTNKNSPKQIILFLLEIEF